MRIQLHVLAATVLFINMVNSQGYLDQEPDSCKGCERKYTYRSTRTGIFTSPMFPDDYPDHTMCCYFFQAKDNGRVRIEFDIFSLEGSSENDFRCRYDYIEISSINDRGFKAEPKLLYCGKTTPPVYISAHSKLEIVFKSDVTTTEKGFLGHYEFLDANWHPFPLPTTGCQSGYLTGPGGIIQSPNFPEEYPPEAGCSWVIQAKPTERILLTFITLDITANEKCQSTNMLMILEGFSLPNPDTVRYCGQIESGERREYLSTGDRLVLRFESGGNYGNNRGFSLTWSAVTLVDEDQCDGFQCSQAGAEVCNNDLGKKLCRHQRYCMDDTLRCNEMPNCGATDNSDENKCLNYIMRYVGIIGGSILVVVIIIVIIAVCCYKRHKKDRVKYSVPSDPSASQSMSTFLSTHSSNLPVRSLEHSPRSSCVMYTTSFTDCALNDGASSTPNHSLKPTFHSFSNNSNCNALHPSNCTLDTTTHDVTDRANDVKDGAKGDVTDSPASYKGHQKRPSYHMMRELCYEDGNIVLADI